jgi:hypothetical protein
MSTKSPQVLWHYTIGTCFGAILRDGQINPSKILVEPGERSITWFSANPIWEITASRTECDGSRRMLSLEEMENRFGLYRIGVNRDESFKPWLRLLQRARIPDWRVRDLETTGRARGANPYDWWGCLGPVPTAKWVFIETWNSDRWVDRRSVCESILADWKAKASLAS